ncbi:CHAT domain-containing protein [Streptosporangium sp. NPDC002524]|uniref:CHAT domain-containing tetratricopeptide repeat protein n=1 Tax=Streptosporangium sp. NPDC002524 TaxID=3154537 RepID=UPI0033230ABE
MPRWVFRRSRAGDAEKSLAEARARLNAGELDAAVDALRRTPPGGPERRVLAGDLGLALRLRFDRTGSEADLDAAIAVGGESVAGDAAHDPDLAFHLSALANSLHLRFDHRGDPADIDATVGLSKAAVEASGSGDPSYAMYLSNHGNALRDLAERTGSAADLEDAVRYGRAAVAAAAPRDANLPMYRANLSLALRVCFERTLRAEDLDESIEVGRRGLEDASEDDPNRPAWLSNLCGSLRTRYDWYGGPADLDAAVEAGRQAVRGADPEDPDIGMYLSNLGVALNTRFGASGRDEDIDAAADALGHAIESTADDDPDLPMYLNNLGLILRTRFDRRGDLADLEAALAAGRDAVARTPEGSPDLSLYQGNYGATLCERYTHTGGLADLDEAITVVRAAVDGTTDHDVAFAMCMANLGMTLRERHLRRGDEADLDEAIDAERIALAGIPDGHFQRADFLTNLALSLRLRYEFMGIRRDLDEAVELARTAYASVPPDNPGAAIFRSNLATATHARYELTLADSDLEDTVRFSREAVEACPRPHPDRALYLHNLGLALEDRFSRRGGAQDLADAVEAGRAALRAMVDSDPLRPLYIAALADRLRTRAERTGDEAELREAVRLGRQAVESTPVDHPDRASTLLSLADAVHADAVRSASPTGYDEALTWVRTAAGLPTARVKDRIRAAHRWGVRSWERGDEQDAALGFATAIELLPTLAWHGFDRETQEDSLAVWNGLVSQAVSCLAISGQPRRAVELAEQGRSVLWGQLLHLRGAVQELGDAHPELAAELRALRTRLDRPAEWSRTSRLFRGGARMGTEASLVERRRAARRWDALISQVRDLDGFTDFQRAAPFEALAEAAEYGPVVLLNTSSLGCHAIVVSAGDARVVPLDLVTHAEIVRLTDSWSPVPVSGAAERVTTAELLASLWQTIVAPVLAAMDRAAGQTRPRVWWSPIGPASFLPLHAAEDRNDSAAAHVVSSYTPTLAALLEARAKPRPAAVRQLVIGLPRLTGQTLLPGTAREIAAVAKRLPADRVHVLSGADATADAVRSELRRSQWVHFACHARHDHRHPVDSAFLLWDWRDDPLTVGELAQEQLADADLAVLSACETSGGSARLYDESVNLAAAMRIVGFRHVIATLWPVTDAIACRMVTALYAALVPAGVPDSDASAFALDAAVRRLRKRYPRDPEQWAAFIHVGL